MSADIFAVAPLGLVISGNGLEPEYDDWLNYGRKLYGEYKALQWAIGDWLNYGEAHYGETYTQALEIFPEHAYGTMTNYKYVAGRVEFSRRRENLSWSHHAEVAPLEPGEQVEWLDRAEAEHWTKAELNQALVTAGAKKKFAPTADEINDLPAPPLAGTVTMLRDATLEAANRPDTPAPVAGLLRAAGEMIGRALEWFGQGQGETGGDAGNDRRLK